MKVILALGAPHSRFAQVFEHLLAGTVAQAIPSRYDSRTPERLLAELLASHGVDARDPRAVRALDPGKVWTEMAVDLFMANIDQPAWGWADRNTAMVMDFWAEFDPQVRFVICYESPAAYLGNALSATAEPQASQIDDALEVWRRWNSFLLDAHRRHRQRSLLVNSLEVLAQPDRLLRAMDDEWGLRMPDVRPRMPAGADVSEFLAANLFPPHHTAWTLAESLDAAAQVPSAPPAAGDRSTAMWTAWTRVQKRLGDLKQLAGLQAAQALAASASAERDEAEARSEELARDLARATQKARDLASEVERLTASGAELTAQVAEWKKRAAEKPHTDDFAQLAERLSGLQQHIEQESIRAAELMLENQHLVAALHEAQEQLEIARSTLKVDLRSEGAPAAAHPPPPRTGALAAMTEVAVDLRGHFPGENWYDAEEDGRWAGPGLSSSIGMPPLRPGAYALELCLADAMAPDIAYGLRLEAFGREVPFEFSHAAAQGAFPVVCRGAIEVPAGSDAKPWQLALRFPRTVSPADVGSDDQRHLALRVRSLKLKPSAGVQAG